MPESENNHPLHVAIIPDGNRRWAKNKGLKPWEGHKAGADIIEEITREALNLGIKCISFWGSSADNLKKRPLEEKRALLKIYEKYFEKLINSKDIYEKEARINIIGLWEEQFPEKLKKILKEGITKTKKHTKHFLNFLLAYNGDDDVLQAVKQISNKVRNSQEDIEITKTMIQENLMTSELPKVDLIIRTGVEGDPHNSAGFLMWQTQNSQYHFSEKFFPEFNAEEFKRAIESYKNREKRFGK